MEKKKKKKLSRIITIRLLIAVLIALFVSVAVMYTILYMYCEMHAYELLQYNTSGLTTDLEAETQKIAMNATADEIATSYWKGGREAVMPYLQGSNYSYFVKRDGTIVFSDNENFEGKNVRDIQMIGGIIDGLFKAFDDDSDVSEVMYQVTPIPVKTLDGKLDVYYLVVASREHPDEILTVAWTVEAYEMFAESAAGSVAFNRRIGTTGFYVLIPPDNLMFASDETLNDKPFPYMQIIDRFEKGSDESVKTFMLDMLMPDKSTEKYEYKIMYDRGVFWDKDCYYSLFKEYNVYMLSLYPVKEAMTQAEDTLEFIFLVEIVVFSVLFIVLRSLIKRMVVRKLDSVNASLAAITNGDLDRRVEVRDTREFDTLSNDINATVDRLKQYIDEAAARIDADLAVAKAIQISALPNVFPPFPERKEFELFASMNAAKEVGGDFYDFYMLNDHTLGFLIADVSGKSIPGAMFMMTSKSIIKSLAESGLAPAEVFTRANEKLCEGNEAEMFVTAWLGYLDLNTGFVRVANAGHNPPVLIRGGKAEYIQFKPGLMLAGMDGLRYSEQSIQLEKGDMLYLYTDGVTEAMNKAEEQYGEERLKELLSFGESYPEPSADNGIVEPVCRMVAADVEKFTDGAEQSDDITMLCVRFLGTEAI